MKNKTVPTEAFPITYRVIQRDGMFVRGSFDSIADAKNFVYTKYPRTGDFSAVLPIGYREEERRAVFSGGAVQYVTILKNRWCITNQWRDVVDPKIIDATGPRYVPKNYSFYYHRYDAVRKGLVKKKNDGLKIKTVWAYTNRWSPYLKEWCFKKAVRNKGFATLQERRANVGCMHEDFINEYGTVFVRGKRRKSYLPTTWDKTRLNRDKCFKSWKHNSKRGKQWKPKDTE